MTIKELKEQRDALHAMITPLVQQEYVIRAEIKSINEELFQLEMKPIMYKLEADISAGVYQGQELVEKQAKLGRLRTIIK